MRICAIVKYPPIEGGVAAQTYWMCRALAARGHEVFVVTNAAEVEPDYRIWLYGDDEKQLEAQFPSGGSVRVRSAHQWDARQYAHVPAGNPAAAKLAAMATEVVREQDCDIIVAFYLEPYGIAANLASSWTGRPFVVRHSGSDRYRLMTHPDLGLAYKEVLRAASGVLSAGVDLSGFGIPAERVYSAPGSYTPAIFGPAAAPLDLNGLIRQLSAEGSAALRNTAELSDDLPKLGIYGKFGPTKGTIDLLQAVARLRAQGTVVQLVLLGGGTGWPAVDAAIRDAGIGDITWRLPFVAPWRVPGFIRACDVICFVEHGFTITQHRPGVPGEVMACGTPLVLSREIAEKQAFADELADGRNCYLVADPSDQDALAAAIGRAVADRAQSRRVGLAATRLVERLDDNDVGAGYEKALAACLGAQMRAPLGGLARVPADGSFRGSLEQLLRARCPVITAMAGHDLPGLLDEAVESQAVRQTSVLAAAHRLCCEIVRDSSYDPGGLAAQASRVEQYLLWFDVDDEGIRGVATFGIPVQTATQLPRAGQDSINLLRPVLTRLCRIERFSIDIGGYTRAIKDRVAGREGGACVRVPGHIAVFHKFAHLGGTVYRIDAATEQVLSACTGEMTLAEILSAADARGASRANALRLIERMLDVRLIALAASSAA